MFQYLQHFKIRSHLFETRSGDRSAKKVLLPKGGGAKSNPYEFHQKWICHGQADDAECVFCKVP